MFNRIRTATRIRFARTNFNSFLFFLFFAVVIWFFVQFSKRYNQIINIPISYYNVPPDKLLSLEKPRSVKLQMEENGFKIAWFSLFPPTLRIDVARTIEQDGKLFYVFDENRNQILSQLDIDFEDTRFVKEALAIDYQQREKKKVPVVSRVETLFAAGYGAAEGLDLRPDSVMVSGPDDVLDTLTRLYTLPVKLTKISEDLEGTVRIDTSNLRNLSLYREEFAYSLNVEKFTEGKVRVPIELINVPDNQNIVIFPKETMLFYRVNLKDYEKVTASDFRVVADLATVEEDQDFLLPRVIEKPVFTSNIRLNEKKIQFVIKK